MESLQTGWDFFQNEVLGMKWLSRLIGGGLEAYGLDTAGRIGGSIQFFLYDTIKIMVLLGVLILLISYSQKELLRNCFNNKLLWAEYLEECRQSGDEPLMYSQVCYYIQQDEQKHRATMHINRKPGEQI